MTVPATTLYLVRHAEQEHTPDEDPAAGISALGREQARLLADRLRTSIESGMVPLAGIHHSPLLRAEQTARLLADGLPGVPVQSSELLTDRTPFPEPGRESDYSERELEWLAGVPPGERDAGAKIITAAIAHFASLGDSGTGHHLLVTHAFVVGWFVRAALDAPVSRWLGLNPFNAGLTVIRYAPERPPAVISYNDVGHLSPGSSTRW
jgi:serine/threonine-protein phosphatase PGAM5